MGAGMRHERCRKGAGPDWRKQPEAQPVKPDEIRKLTKFFRAKFRMPDIEVRKRPQKTDSAEVYIGDEFIGVIFRDDEEGDLSYNFQMAILDFDLEE